MLNIFLAFYTKHWYHISYIFIYLRQVLQIIIFKKSTLGLKRSRLQFPYIVLRSCKKLIYIHSNMSARNNGRQYLLCPNSIQEKNMYVKATVCLLVPESWFWAWLYQYYMNWLRERESKTRGGEKLRWVAESLMFTNFHKFHEYLCKLRC